MTSPPDGKRCKRVKRNGEHCKAWAVKGTTLCSKHGGMAPQIRAAGERREALARVERMAVAAGTDMDPLEHLLDGLYRSYRLVVVYGAMVSAIDALAEEEAAADERIRGELGYSENTNERDPDELIVWSNDRLLALNSKGEAQLHPYQQAYERAIERHGKLAKLCIDVGISERQMAIAEGQAQQLAAIVTAILTDLGHDLTEPHVRDVVRLRLIEGGKAA